MKEIAVSTYLLFPLFLWMYSKQSPRRRAFHITPYFLLLLGYLAYYRFVVLTKLPPSTSHDSLDWMTTISKSFPQILEIVSRLLFPFSLHSDYPPIQGSLSCGTQLNLDGFSLPLVAKTFERLLSGISFSTDYPPTSSCGSN